MSNDVGNVWPKIQPDRLAAKAQCWHDSFKRPRNDYIFAIGVSLFVIAWTSEYSAARFFMIIIITGAYLVFGIDTERDRDWSNPITATPEDGHWSGEVDAGAWISETRKHSSFPLWLRACLYLSICAEAFGYVGLTLGFFKNSNHACIFFGFWLLTWRWVRFRLLRLLFHAAGKADAAIFAWAYGGKQEHRVDRLREQDGVEPADPRKTSDRGKPRLMGH